MTHSVVLEVFFHGYTIQSKYYSLKNEKVKKNNYNGFN
jgi:hypothetical protein